MLIYETDYILSLKHDRLSPENDEAIICRFLYMTLYIYLGLNGLLHSGAILIWDLLSTGLILGLRPSNERRRYFVTTSLIGWAQA